MNCPRCDKPVKPNGECRGCGLYVPPQKQNPRLEESQDDEERPAKEELPNCVWRDAETPFADNH